MGLLDGVGLKILRQGLEARISCGLELFSYPSQSSELPLVRLSQLTFSTDANRHLGEN
jgi:hypothetical protein